MVLTKFIHIFEMDNFAPSQFFHNSYSFAENLNFLFFKNRFCKDENVKIVDFQNPNFQI